MSATNWSTIEGFFLHLIKSNEIFLFRCRVPKQLVPFLGTREIKRSLKTRDKRLARAAAAAYTLALERLRVIVMTGLLDDLLLQRALQKFKDGFLSSIESARDTGMSTLDFLLGSHTGTGINGTRDLFFIDDLLGENGIAKDREAAISNYNAHIKALKEELATGTFEAETRMDVIAFIETTGINVQSPPKGWLNPNDDLWHMSIKGDFLKVVRRFLQMRIDCYMVEIERLKGNYSNSYDVSVRNRRCRYLLSQAIEDFCQQRKNERSVNPLSQKRYRQYLDVMLQLLGDRDVTEFTRQDLLDLKTKLYNRPANLSKNPAGTKLLDKRSVETNYTGKIVSVFRWLHLNKYIDDDLTPGLVRSLTATEKKERKRNGYNDEELKKIFDLLPFDPVQPHMAWVPLIALYSGARQGEICQLLVSDIKEADGIPYMHITEEDESGKVVKSVKNESSKRSVPIHHVIVEMGFLEFVKLRKTQGKQVLFESQLRSRYGTKPLTGQYYSKRFQAFNRKQITSDPKKVFHSFRHMVHNQLKQKRVPTDLYHAITGHTPQYEMDLVYTEDFALVTKYDALLKLEYPAVDLQVLKGKFKALLDAMALT